MNGKIMENHGTSTISTGQFSIANCKRLPEAVCYWKLPIEFVDLAIKNGDFPLFFVCLPEGKTEAEWSEWWYDGKFHGIIIASQESTDVWNPEWFGHVQRIILRSHCRISRWLPATKFLCGNTEVLKTCNGAHLQSSLSFSSLQYANPKIERTVGSLQLNIIELPSWFHTLFGVVLGITTMSNSLLKKHPIAIQPVIQKTYMQLVIPIYGVGSIPINTIFSGMNIHLPAILMFTRGTRFWPIPIYYHCWIIPYYIPIWQAMPGNSWAEEWWSPAAVLQQQQPFQDAAPWQPEICGLFFGFNFNIIYM